MKYVYLAIGGILVLALGAAIAAFLFPKETYKAEEIPSTPFVLTPETTMRDSAVTPGTQTQAAITDEFREAVEDSERLTLPKMAVMGEYALSIYQDENIGGMALLKYEGGSWTFVAGDGGVFSLSRLQELGVPMETAQELLRALY
jgi:hypothetical protein